MSPNAASVATRRFGLGPRPGDMRRVASDPRGYVLSALTRPQAAAIADPALRSTRDNLLAVTGANPMRPGRQPAAPPEMAAGTAMAMGGVPVQRDMLREERAARLAHGFATDDPLIERLAMFWSNHFAVITLQSPFVHVTAGSYEREVIRPHVLGRFADMLKAAAQHPCLLHSLDNVQSMGPNSADGRRHRRGINENLARETLELHTLGIDGGYTQQDVASLALVLSGWTVGETHGADRPGEFVFNALAHEPGEQTVLGKRYADRGLETGEQVLADLARHPATARHVARKLARHFVGHAPPGRLVERLETAFVEGDGDLALLTRALVTADDCWHTPARKVLPPYDFMVAVMRGTGLGPSLVDAVGLAAMIGQPMWQPASPKGWPDEDDVWAAPSALRERMRILDSTARIAQGRLDPRTLAEDLLGAAMRPETRSAIARAESRDQGLVILFMSPELQRR